LAPVQPLPNKGKRENLHFDDPVSALSTCQIMLSCLVTWWGAPLVHLPLGWPF